MSKPVLLKDIVRVLRAADGVPGRPLARGAYELVLWENVAYLASDEQRAAVWRRLKREIGLDPGDILSAPEDALLDVLENSGMHRQTRAVRLREIASRVLEEHDGRLETALELPLAGARKAIKKFPAIGDPGVDKVLLFTKTTPVLALESNGLRVLLRLGHGTEAKNYSTTYKSVQRALADQIGTDCAFLILAYDLLRRHGKETCRRSSPLCDACSLADECPSARAASDH